MCALHSFRDNDSPRALNFRGIHTVGGRVGGLLYRAVQLYPRLITPGPLDNSESAPSSSPMFSPGLSIWET